MPTHRATASPHVSRRWPRRSAALMALLVLGVSCASDMSAELPERALEQQSPGTEAEAEADTEERVLVVLPTNFPATRISQEQFTRALVSLVKDMPLPEKEASRPQPHSGRKIVLTSGSATGAAWLTALAQDYGRFCAQRGTPGDCLDRFGDGPELDNDDKRAIALALAIGPALDAADAEIRTIISPTDQCVLLVRPIGDRRNGRARVAPHAVLRATTCLWPGSPTKVRGRPMRKSQFKTASTEQLVEEFRKLSAEHGHALEAANARAANRRFDTLVAIIQELRSRDPEARPQLLQLLADPEPSTRSWTTTAVLDFAPSEAEQALEELVRTQIGILRFSARRMLEQWREGTFNPPWTPRGG
jgi:hypothetical protein